MRRFAPVIVWILLLGMNMLLAGILAIAEENAAVDNANDQFHYSMSEDDGNKLDALVAEGWK